MKHRIGVSVIKDRFITQAQQLAQRLKLPLAKASELTDFDAILMVDQTLSLLQPNNTQFNPISVDFTHGKVAHRCRHGGGRQQLLARAIGLHKRKTLTVTDATAGLGTDAYILAYLGAKVTMIERNPIIAALLEDGLNRAKLLSPNLKLQLIIANATDTLTHWDSTQYPDVIYLDPMFPETDKSALAKKPMRILREFVGDDQDAQQLLPIALNIATQRVVIKRPRKAPQIAPTPKPNYTLNGKANRFDVYLTKV